MSKKDYAEGYVTVGEGDLLYTVVDPWNGTTEVYVRRVVKVRAKTLLVSTAWTVDEAGPEIADQVVQARRVRVDEPARERGGVAQTLGLWGRELFATPAGATRAWLAHREKDLAAAEDDLARARAALDRAIELAALHGGTA